jgi:polyhydroxybutyrate depolymerase
MKNLLSSLLFASSIYLFNINAQTQETRTMTFDGNSREYIIYVPSSYDGSVELPLMFNFHGGGGLSSDFMNYYNDMRPLADTDGFIAVYPQASVDPVDGSYAWLHKAPTSHDDVFFIEAIIDTLSNEFSIDNDRVYACGYSEGGIFSYELACRLNNRIAAISSVSGSMLADSFRDSYYDLGFCSPVHPTAVLLIPGTADSNPHSSYNGFPPYYMSVEEITTYWSNFNNTDINPIINPLPNTNASDGSSVEQRIWENGDNCSRVEELKVIGGDHDWPGVFGNIDIDATTRIWNFVSQFNINGLIECESLSTNQQINTKLEYLVYPNPLTHRLLINISGNEILIFKIFNIQGKIVLDGRLSPGTNYINTINLRQGIYFLKIKNKTIKLIKN